MPSSRDARDRPTPLNPPMSLPRNQFPSAVLKLRQSLVARFAMKLLHFHGQSARAKASGVRPFPEPCLLQSRGCESLGDAYDQVLATVRESEQSTRERLGRSASLPLASPVRIGYAFLDGVLVIENRTRGGRGKPVFSFLRPPATGPLQRHGPGGSYRRSYNPFQALDRR
jgi:hypothetical protein